MRALIFIGLLLTLRVDVLTGQFDCGNLEFLGTYFNNRNTSELSLLLTNKSPVNDGNQNVYTRFFMINDAGDTILKSQPVFTLPHSVQDTIVYRVPLHEAYRHIYELPDYRCGRLVMEDPSCEINYCFDAIPELNLPKTQIKDCDDFEIVGIYETANGGRLDYSVILTNNNRDSARAWDLGYTNFQFFDRWGEEISVASGPSFIVPMQSGDSIIVHLDFKRRIAESEVLLLRMTNPDCTVPYISSTIVSDHSVNDPEYEVFPNPASDVVNLRSIQDLDQWVLGTLSGKTLKSGSGDRINIEELSPGLYTLKINWGDLVTIKVLVKH